MRAAALVTSVFATIVDVTLTSCDRSPTTPSATPPLPPQTVTTRVELIAPRSLAPGASEQLRLIAHRSDGTTVDMTTSASFSSSQPGILAITPPGIATGVRVGESTAYARSLSLSSIQEVVVVPDGTYRVTGQVVEADPPETGISGARVEADGVIPTLTDSQGYYRLYGVAGHARMQVSKPGYVTKEQTLAVSDHHTQKLALTLVAPRLDVSGTYQLVIEANPACRGRIPEAVLTRRYTAEVTQTGAVVRGRVSGATFVANRNHFSGLVDPTGAVLEFYYDPYYDGGGALFAEIIDEATYLVIGGQAPLSPVGRGFAATLDGVFVIFSEEPRRDAVRATCNSSHRLTLSR